ncbi:sensor domain-containing diguanylate cyclase [Sphingosinicella sp. CPCC 101087]|uniref:sensor domain-containing diguanylate cyclase n=1 Tax=Sphingosinicella sp. CPCC 101087 TaxID=2497754 RepID=UPI00101B83E7|nr:sensor domain-containing diguanylate cyclase [Sphingosinicella sp. CPCC 101087]
MKRVLGRASTWFARHFGPNARESRESESLRMLAELGGEVIFRFGVDGKARYISPSVARLLGCTPQDIYAAGGDVVSNNFVYEEDRQLVATAVRQHFAGSLPEVKLEFRMRRSDGSLIWVETNCSTVEDPKTGQPTDILFTMRDISEKKGIEAELEALARTDGLTGLSNRRAFDEAFDRAWQHALDCRGMLSLLLFDIDCFKSFNDANGHQVGDDCLRTVARTIGTSLKRAHFLAARYGGEEFVVIAPGTDQSEATALAETTRLAIEALALPHPSSGIGPNVTVSVGVATAMATAGGTTRMPEGLLQAADTALYKAKSMGRNRVETTLLLAKESGLRAAS